MPKRIIQVSESEGVRDFCWNPEFKPFRHGAAGGDGPSTVTLSSVSGRAIRISSRGLPLTESDRSLAAGLARIDRRSCTSSDHRTLKSRVCKCVSVQVCKCISVQVCKCVSVQVCAALLHFDAGRFLCDLPTPLDLELSRRLTPCEHAARVGLK